MDKEVGSEDVQGKREAAKRWANHVTADPQVGATWCYLLVSETDIKTAKGSWPALKKLGVLAMEEKLTYYDIVAHIVPGTLVLGVLALMPRVFGFVMPWPSSDLIGLAAGLPLAYAVGQVVQALSSLVQPIYYKLWGGMPSAVILEGDSKRLKGARLTKIIAALSEHFHSPAGTAEEREGLFADAMALCNRDGLGRVDSFNASYAFHRALLTTGVVSTVLLTIALVLSLFGVASTASTIRPSLVYLLVLSLLLTAIEFVRARQRGEYFSIEVLNMAYIQSLKGTARRAKGSE